MYNYDEFLSPMLSNNREFMIYFLQLKNIATTMFNYENVPKGFNTRYLEQTLFWHGASLVFKDETFGLINSQVAYSGFNVYGDPIDFTPITKTSIQLPNQNEDTAVFLRNTPDIMPTFWLTLKYARDLYDIDSTRNINIKAQKTPVLILTDKKQIHTMKAVYEKYSGNEPVIYGVKDTFDPNTVRVLNTGAPFIAGELQDIKLSILYEYLTALGIAKTQEKKERLVDDEVQESKAEATAFSNIFLKSREEGVKRINEMFGTNIEVSLSTDIEQLSPKYQTTASTEKIVATTKYGKDTKEGKYV